MNQVTRAEFSAMVARQDMLDADIHEIRSDIKQIRHDTAAVVEMFHTLSGGFRLLLLLGKGALAITALGSAIAAFKHGWFK